MADILDIAERRKRHRADGQRNVRVWLLALTGVSGPEATARRQTMRAMRQLPHATQGFHSGSKPTTGRPRPMASTATTTASTAAAASPSRRCSAAPDSTPTGARPKAPTSPSSCHIDLTTFTRRLRAIAWEGCDAPAATIDHTTEWTTNGGRTDHDNGVPCCHHDNPWRTRHGYRIVRQPDATYHTLRPDGTRINSPPAA